MLSTLTGAWRMLIQRLASDWLILMAAVATILLATILLAAGPIYANAVTLSALQRTVANASVGEAQVEIEQHTPLDLDALSNRVVEETTQETLSSIGAQVLLHRESESYGLPTQTNADKVDLAVFHYFEDIDAHATLVAGTWPAESSFVVEAALPTTTAGWLDLQIGDEFVATNRNDGDLTADVRVVGIYEIDDASDPYWFEDPLALDGIVESRAFATYGPFVVGSAALTDQLVRRRVVNNWRVFPNYDDLTVSGIGSLRGRISGLEDRLNTAFFADAGDAASSASELETKEGISTLLSETERSLTVTRSSVLALLLQLAILAGYTLALTSGLLVGARRTETHLLRSRGASPAQMGLISVLEGVLLTVPAALAAPWLASRAVELLNEYGPLAAIGLNISAEPTPEAYLLAGVAALGAIVALAWPAYRAAKKFPDSRNEGRQQRRSNAQKAGVDIALLLLAVLAFWQLQSLGPRITATIQGRFGVDPLLLIAPALGLAAGAILALRIVPMMARIAEAAASAGRQVVSALSAWQVSRRPVRYARSSLLLIMAVGIGFFTAGYSTTWRQSQQDQAEYQVGADLRVSPNRRTNDSITDVFLSSAHEMVGGVDNSMPVVRKNTQLTRFGGAGQYLLIDAARAGQIVQIREDLAPDFESLMADLFAQRPTMAGIPLPGEPTELGLVLAAHEEWDFSTKFLGPRFDPGFELRVSAIVQDGDGYLHRLRLGSVPVNIGTVRLETELTYPLEDRASATPRFPLSLVDIEILSPIPLDSPHQAEVELTGIFVSLADTGWQNVEVDLSQSAWEIDMSTTSGLFASPSIGFSRSQPPLGLSVAISTGTFLGSVSAPQYFSIRPQGTDLPETFPIVATESFLETNATSVGELVNLPALNIPIGHAEIAGDVASFPTIEPETAEVVIIDLPTFQMMSYRPGAKLESASEYWLSTTGDDGGTHEAELLGPSFDSVWVEGTESRTSTLTSDPVAVGAIGALTLGFVAAAIFATVGFAVSATVSARERMGEFALLRALGLSPKQLASWLSLEQGVLVLVSLALGTLVGIVLTALVLPLVTLNQEGANVMPELLVIYPWQTVMQLELAVLLTLTVTVLLITLLVKKLGLGSVLRLGDT